MAFISANKSSVKIMFALTAVAFLWISVIGLFYHMNEMKADGTAGGCLLNEQLEVCNMNFSEHIILWQKMFTILPRETKLLSLFVLAILLAALIVLRQKFLREFSRRVASFWKLYIQQHPQINLFNFIEEEFSQGILNPKIYEKIIV